MQKILYFTNKVTKFGFHFLNVVFACFLVFIVVSYTLQSQNSKVANNPQHIETYSPTLATDMAHIKNELVSYQELPQINIGEDTMRMPLTQVVSPNNSTESSREMQMPPLTISRVDRSQDVDPNILSSISKTLISISDSLSSFSNNSYASAVLAVNGWTNALQNISSWFSSSSGSVNVTITAPTNKNQNPVSPTNDTTNNYQSNNSTTKKTVPISSSLTTADKAYIDSTLNLKIAELRQEFLKSISLNTINIPHYDFGKQLDSIINSVNKSVDLNSPALSLSSDTNGPLQAIAGAFSATSSLSIFYGGTGATTANNALNNLLPSQVGNAGEFLTTDGTNSSWATVNGGAGADEFTHPASGKSATTSEIQITGGLLSTASTTLSNNVFFSSLTQGYNYVGSNGLVSTVSTSTLAGQVFPFTSNTNYNATGTAIGFQGGLFSTASSTFSNNLFLSSLSSGGLAVGTNGLVYTGATTTFGTGYATTTGNSVAFSTTTQSFNGLTIAQNITTNGGALLFTPNLSGTLALTGGGTNNTAFSPNTIVTVNSAGNALISTSSQLTVGNLIATTTANSYFLGSLGIGTTSPFYSLHIASTTGAQIGLLGDNANNIWTMRSIGGNFYMATASPTTWATTTVPAFIVQSNGSFWIGTTTLSTTSSTGRLTIASSTGPQLSLWGNAVDNPWNFRSAGGFLYIGTSSLATWATSSVPALTVASNGSILIGTTTFSTASSTGRLTIASSTGAQLSLWGNAVDNAWNFRSAGGNLYIGTSSLATWATSSVPSLILQSNGTAWIGTTTFSAASSTGVFHIASSTGAQLSLWGANTDNPWNFRSIGSNLYIGTSSLATWATTSVPGLTLFNGGSVGIATSSPYKTLAVVGTMAISGLDSSTAGNAVCILTTTIVTAGNTTCTTSSLKTKHDISDIQTNVANEIMSMRPVQYITNESNEARYGFIAEEVATIDPKLVEYAKQDIKLFDGQIIKKGDPLSVDYLRYTGILTKFVQNMNINLESLASTTVPASAESQSFVAGFFNNLFARINTWLADAGNNIGSIFAATIHAKESICIDDVCVNKDQLQALLNAANVQNPTNNNSNNNNSNSIQNNSSTQLDATTTDSTASTTTTDTTVVTDTTTQPEDGHPAAETTTTSDTAAGAPAQTDSGSVPTASDTAPTNADPTPVQ